MNIDTVKIAAGSVVTKDEAHDVNGEPWFAVIIDGVYYDICRTSDLEQPELLDRINEMLDEIDDATAASSIEKEGKI